MAQYCVYTIEGQDPFMSGSMMYSHYERGNDDELDRKEGWVRLAGKNTSVAPKSRPVVPPADCSLNDSTTFLHDRQRVRKARKQLPFHMLTAYLHIDDVPFRPHFELASFNGRRVQVMF